MRGFFIALLLLAGQAHFATPARAVTYDAVVVSGGGPGGGGFGGGGGAGGILSFTAESIVGLSFPVTIGAGGTQASVGTRGTNGVNSSAFGLTPTGGGAGGINVAGQLTGTAGGSGGGGSADNGGTAGAGTALQGKAGGNGINFEGGGGGGKGVSGTAAVTTENPQKGGPGGAGIFIDWIGNTLGGGGGGGSFNNTSLTAAAGGIGGGGAGAINSASSRPVTGTANTGGGGGGAAAAGTIGPPGGSGIVAIRYPSAGLVNGTGGTITSFSSGGITYTVHKFTSDGTFVPPTLASTDRQIKISNVLKAASWSSSP